MTTWPAVAVLAGLAAGCTGVRSLALPGSSASARNAMADADREAVAGRVREANARYETIVTKYPDDPVAAEALHRMAMLRVESKSPLRDRRAAQTLLRRLATEYGTTLWGREARAWQGLLREIDRCEAEATRRGADAQKLRETLDSIRDSDLELEQHP